MSLRLRAFWDKDKTAEEREEKRLLLAARRGSRQQTADDMRGGLTPMMASRSRNGIPRSQSSGSRWIARAWLSPLRF